MTEYKCPETRTPSCPYCNSKNRAVRETYYDMTCCGCMSRMNEMAIYGGRKRGFSVLSVIRGLFTRKVK